MTERKIIAYLMGLSIILNAAIAVVGPFFPPEAEKKGVDLKTIGFIFSTYPTAFVTVSLLMPSILCCINQKVVFIVCSIIYALSIAGFGSLVFMNRESMIICGFVFRFLQGSANAGMYTISYSIFSSEHEGSDFMKVNSLFKATIGVGLLLGLLFGTLLYIIGGYFLPFLVYCVLMLTVTPLAIFLVPRRLKTEEQEAINPKSTPNDIEKGNKGEDIETAKGCDNTCSQEPNNKRISIENVTKPFKISVKLLRNTAILKCLVLAIIDMSLLNFAPAILSRRLSEMHVDKSLYGLFFALPFIFPIFSAIIVVKLMDRGFDMRLLLCMGKLFMSVGFMLIGPSNFWGFEENIWIMLLGICILGFSASFAVLPLMPIIMNEIKIRFNFDKSCIIETASSLYNSAFGLGNIIGPIVGAHLSSYFGFRICTDILSHFSMIVFIFLLVSQYFHKIVKLLKKNETVYATKLSGRKSTVPIQSTNFVISCSDECPNLDEVKQSI